jgi:hypothetical protein
MARGSYSGGSSLIGWSSEGYRDKLRPRKPKRKALGKPTAASVKRTIREDLVVFGRTAEDRAAFVETLRPIVAEITSGEKNGPYHLTSRLNAMGVTTAQGGKWGLRRVNLLLLLLAKK